LKLEDNPGFFDSVKSFLGVDKPPSDTDPLHMIGLVDSLISPNCDIIAKNH